MPKIQRMQIARSISKELNADGFLVGRPRIIRPAKAGAGSLPHVAGLFLGACWRMTSMPLRSVKC
jgi:hypothetical protein